LLGYSLLQNFKECCELSLKYNIGLFQANVVGGSLNKMRTDPMYKYNYRTFISSTKHMQDLPESGEGIHKSQREPFVNLPRVNTNDLCFIHLQAINTKFYAFKQVYYKIDQLLNNKENGLKVIKDIDAACNNLIFNEVNTPTSYVTDWKFDASVFDKLLKHRNYDKFVYDYIRETGDTSLCDMALRFSNE
jgi:hypothetical protein